MHGSPAVIAEVGEAGSYHAWREEPRVAPELPHLPHVMKLVPQTSHSIQYVLFTIATQCSQSLRWKLERG